MKTIILNPAVGDRIDYEAYKDLMSFEDYLSMKTQRQVFETNQKGYERYSTR